MIGGAANRDDDDLRSDFPGRGKAAKSVVAGKDTSGKPVHAASHGNKGNKSSKSDKDNKGNKVNKGNKGGKD